MSRKPRKKARSKHPKYEQRLILFLDFLGFKEIVEDTIGNETRLDKLLAAIDYLHEIGSDDKDLYSSACVTTFSDSVVLSYGVREQSAVFYLLLDIAYAIIGLVGRGFLVRGAVTIGELVHTKNTWSDPRWYGRTKWNPRRPNFLASFWTLAFWRSRGMRRRIITIPKTKRNT